tara:strand:- start:641 stop:970 length:330 start_codon:yes stop_codon:yes gene_type:complete
MKLGKIINSTELTELLPAIRNELDNLLSDEQHIDHISDRSYRELIGECDCHIMEGDKTCLVWQDTAASIFNDMIEAINERCPDYVTFDSDGDDYGYFTDADALAATLYT